jgi:hypothetical protein
MQTLIKPMWVLLKSVSIAFLILILIAFLLILPMFLNGRPYPGTNEEYLNHLASIVLLYQKKHSKTPEGFEIAHRESKIVLPRRGDKNGNSLLYRKIDDKSFFFRALGQNRKDELGLGDDLDVYYINMEKVDRKEFIQYIKQLDEQIKAEYYLDFFEHCSTVIREGPQRQLPCPL